MLVETGLGGRHKLPCWRKGSDSAGIGESVNMIAQFVVAVIAHVSPRDVALSGENEVDEASCIRKLCAVDCFYGSHAL